MLSVTARQPGYEMPQAHGTADRSAGNRPLDDESREWLRCLADHGQDGRGRIERERCLAQLHGMLVRAARAELRRRSGPAPIEGHEREDMAHQAAGDAMLAIIRKLGEFRGESRFTTWAYKFVVLEVSAQLGRRFRRHSAVQIGDEAWDRIPDRLGVDPARHAESAELAEALRAAVEGSLSERQRRVFVALVVEGIPLDALTVELGSTRNAIYKTMFDARRKIRAHLIAHGYLCAK
jgi:RNA polymerase sigma-70 factor (ECF subfamily)